MDQLACIKAFIAIKEQGSIKEAAKKLYQTDAAISKKLSKLEVSLKVSLMDRSPGNFTLTPIGEQYYAICQETMEKLASTEQLIQQIAIAPRGELKVTCDRVNTHQYLIPKLKSFIKKYPYIHLNFNTAERVPDFSRGDSDILFGVGMSFPGQEELVQKRLGITRDILCATPTYLKQTGIPKKPKDILNLEYICHSQRLPKNIISFDKGIDVAVKPFLKFDDTFSLVSAALQDLGYIHVKEYRVQDELKEGKLVEILPQFHKTPISIYIYYRHQTYPDPKVRAFIDHFK